MAQDKQLDEAYLGTEKKYLIKIESSGFNMDLDEFELIIKRGPNSVRIDKRELVIDEDGNFYVSIDTTPLGVGKASMVVKAYVPDEDCSEGTREEVGKFDFLKVRGI